MEAAEKPTEGASTKITVWGMSCTWWGSIEEASTTDDTEQPCCPHCGMPLYEQEEELFQRGLAATRQASPDYYELWVWMRGKCFPSFLTAKEAYAASLKVAPQDNPQTPG